MAHVRTDLNIGSEPTVRNTSPGGETGSRRTGAARLCRPRAARELD
jgi:hypothetical protein